MEIRIIEGTKHRRPTGKLITVNGRTYSQKDTWVACICHCGNTFEVRLRNVTQGSTKSCGCLANRKPNHFRESHGQRKTRLYSLWDGMKKRCLNPSHVSYPYYGARGIGICQEWTTSFTSFRDWAITNGYKDHLTIDRIDNDGDYEPSNCRWISAAANTKRRYEK